MQCELRYEVIEGWEQLPVGYTHRDVAGVAVDSRDHVLILTRGDARVITYGADGTFLGTFGEGMFTERTHGITVGRDDAVYCVDDGDHTVRKFSSEGELLMTIGTAGIASDTGYDPTQESLYAKVASIKRGGPPFNRPTNIAVALSGDIYVSDGYGNARIHRFSADGRLLQSWGGPGTGPGQFNLPHDVCVAADGRVLVADRENDRIQIFGGNGEFLAQWTDVQHPTGLYINGDGLIYVSELAWRRGQRSFVRGVFQEDRPGRVSVLDANGAVLARWGGTDVCAPGSFCAPHGICADSRGDVYVAEVTYSFAGRDGLVPPGCHTFQKFARR